MASDVGPGGHDGAVTELARTDLVAGSTGGRPAATSALELASAAQRLFVTQGFEQTSVEEITAEVGISRRSFFRYFPTKADVLWAESPAELERLRAALADENPATPYEEVVVNAVLAALSWTPEHEVWARQRAALILTTPAVQAHAALVFGEWRAVAAEFAARRWGLPASDLLPVAIGHAVLAATLAAHEHWISHPGSDLGAALREALGLLLPAPPRA